jgi:hypothetical protein
MATCGDHLECWALTACCLQRTMCQLLPLSTPRPGLPPPQVMDEVYFENFRAAKEAEEKEAETAAQQQQQQQQVQPPPPGGPAPMQFQPAPPPHPPPPQTAPPPRYDDAGQVGRGR